MRTDDASLRLAPRPSRAFDAPEPAPNTADRLSEQVLRGPLTAFLVLAGLGQVLAWLPHYLTWPYWADHDVFALAARDWTRGVLPYRETLLNNLPGTLYLSLFLGTAAGWGRTWGLYAFDAGLLVAFEALLLVWSRRRFGRALPGAVGGLAWLGFALSLDYTRAAQRDWHAPAFALLGLLALQAWPGRVGRLASGVGFALGLLFRPQVVLLFPAVALAVRDSVADEEVPNPGRAAVDWLLPCCLVLAAAVVPLVAAGVFGDCVRGVRMAAYGGAYNRVTPVSVVKAWLLQATAWHAWVVAVVVLTLGLGSQSGSFRNARVWLVAVAGVSLYKPMSPVGHAYLDIPITLVGAVLLTVAVALWLDAPGVPGRARLAGVLLAAGLGVSTLRPEFCNPSSSARAVLAARRGETPPGTPPGYRRGTVASAAFYPWDDYRALLDYLRASTGPQTRVANALKGEPAVCGAVDRRSAFPAESLAWLRMVRPGDEPRFAEALDAADDAVAIWSPGETGPDPSFRVDRIEGVIRRKFRPEAKFGAIEVWRRGPE